MSSQHGAGEQNAVDSVTAPSIRLRSSKARSVNRAQPKRARVRIAYGFGDGDVWADEERTSVAVTWSGRLSVISYVTTFVPTTVPEGIRFQTGHGTRENCVDPAMSTVTKNSFRRAGRVYAR